jgi:hypothetical protein
LLARIPPADVHALIPMNGVDHTTKQWREMLAIERSIAMRRLILAAVTMLVAGGAVIIALGALHVENTEDKVNLTIDKKQLKEKGEEGVNEAKTVGSALLHRSGEALRKAGENLRRTSDGQQTPATDQPPAPSSKRQPENSRQEVH